MTNDKQGRRRLLFIGAVTACCGVGLLPAAQRVADAGQSTPREASRANDAARSPALPDQAAALGPALRDEIDRLTLGSFRGLVVALPAGAEEPVVEAWGRVDPDGEPIGASALFDLADASSMFTGALALRLADRGELDLNAWLEDVFEDVPDRLAKATLLDLLTGEAPVARPGAAYVASTDVGFGAWIEFVPETGAFMSVLCATEWSPSEIADRVHAAATDRDDAEQIDRPN